MNLSAPFIRRPVATTLLTVAIAIAGAIAFTVLPVSPAAAGGFSDDLGECRFAGRQCGDYGVVGGDSAGAAAGHIAGVTEMTSSSSLGTTGITIQFDLSRDIDWRGARCAGGDHAARTYLLRISRGIQLTVRSIRADGGRIMIIGLTSDKYGPKQAVRRGSTIIQQRLSQIQGVGQVNAGGGALPSVRVEVNPTKLASLGLTMANLQAVLSIQNSNLAKGQITNGNISADIVANDQISQAVDYKPIIVGYKNGLRCTSPMWRMLWTRHRTCGCWVFER